MTSNHTIMRAANRSIWRRLPQYEINLPGLAVIVVCVAALGGV